MNGQAILYFISLVLIIVGAINWGYIAYTDKCDDDIVNALVPAYSRWVYAAVGVAGLFLAALIFMRRDPGKVRGSIEGLPKAIYGQVKNRVIRRK